MVQIENRYLKEDCMFSGAVLLPEDFAEISFDYFVNLYREGQLSFCRVMSDEECVVIIPKTPRRDCTGLPRSNEESFKNGECVYCHNGSCLLTYNKTMPRACEDLLFATKPLEYEKIKALIAVKACLDWSPYMNLLNEVFWYLLSEKESKKCTPNGEFDHSQCEMCGGRCCQKCGCYFAPTDFKVLSLDKLRKILNKGFVAIVSLTTELTGISEDVLVLKMRDKGAEVFDKGDRKTGGCIVHEDTGCPFEDDDRPFGGRALVPDLQRGCCIGYSFRKCADDWKPYQNLLRQLAEEYSGKDIPYRGIC